VRGDTAFEPDETFALVLSDPINATIATERATATLVNDDAMPVLGVGDARVAEGNDGTAELIFDLTLDRESAMPVRVLVDTADGTATAGEDYDAIVAGIVDFEPGTTHRTASVFVRGDTRLEEDETLSIDLSTPAFATIGDGSGEGTITDDDAPVDPDAGPSEADAGNVADAGSAADAGAADAGIAPDAEITADAGTPMTSAGCGCIAAGRAPSGWAASLLALATIGGLARRRQKR
jgi:MYXO-CTERM domain-containing protein